MRPSFDQIWQWLESVSDPEIPAISVVDLGIVRDLHWDEAAQSCRLVVSVTPTYSGCPATSVIASDIETELRKRGISEVRVETKLSPPWTTDWISAAGLESLKRYGIAPPLRRSDCMLPIRFYPREAIRVVCPRCASDDTVKVSEFGSTPCKAQYTCKDCLEPFDYFKSF